MREQKKGQAPHLEVYGAMQLARKLFPRRKLLDAYYQSRNTDDGLVVIVPHDHIKGEVAEEYYADAALLNKMKAFGAYRVCSSVTTVEDEDGHKDDLWTRTFYVA